MIRIILIIILYLSNYFCNGQEKVIKLITGGEVAQTIFKEQIPFELRSGIIVVEVYIKGVAYKFILDTGAPTVISKQLAETLDLSYVTKNKVSDSQGNAQNLGFIEIDEFTIGNIQFNNIGSAVADLNKSVEIGCLNVDGIIGANVFRKAIWEFNFKNQTVALSNSASKLLEDDSVKGIKFTQDLVGTPHFTIQLNKSLIIKEVALDIGSTGGFSLPNEKTKGLISNDFNIKVATAIGSSSAGFYGHGEKDTLLNVLIDTIKLDNFDIKNIIVDFTNESSATLGLEFLKNFNVVIDWKNEIFYLTPQRPYTNNTLDSFGFKFAFAKAENAFVIIQLYENSEAKSQGLQLGDVLLSIDEVNFKDAREDDWCEYLNSKTIKDMKVLENKKSLKLTIKRDKKILELNLNKRKLI